MKGKDEIIDVLQAVLCAELTRGQSSTSSTLG